MRNIRGALSVDSTQSRFVKGSTLRSVFIALAVAGALSACSSGGGGDGGNDPGTSGPGVGVDNPSQSGGLLFSYPIDGQTDVYADTQLVIAFPGNVNTDADSFTIVDSDGNTVDGVQADNRGNGVIRLNLTDGAGQLAPNTRYQIQATDSIDSDNTSFDAGDTLISFTTRPAPGAPSGADDFSIAQNTRIGNLRVPFTQFDPIRATFSEPVDEGSIQLCSGMQVMGDNNCTVSVTDSDGTNVPGRLYALGNDFVFDPTTGDVPTDTNNANDYEDGDLIAGETYTVAFSDDVKSAYGNALANDSFQVTPVSIGRDVIQNLVIGDAGDDNSPVSGGARNSVSLASQLIGSYQLAAFAGESGGLKVRLAAPGSSAYNNTFPTVIPAGQKFQLGALNLKLGSAPDGEGGFEDGAIDTPVNLDNLNIQFATDANAYLVGNDLRNIETPTRVTLALDLNITGNVPQGSPIKALSNGVVNQTALNIIASGIAVPQDNGDVSLITTGSFPIAVNRDGQASVDFELELTLPAAREDQPTIMADQTPPRVTAQFPTSCSYTFGLESFSRADDRLSPLSLVEDACVSRLENGRYLYPQIVPIYQQVLADNGGSTDLDLENDPDSVFQDFPDTVPFMPIRPFIDNLSVAAAPSIVFSEPVDPLSLAGNLELATANGDSVAFRARSEGSSVVVTPIESFEPSTSYVLTPRAGITDLAGNGVEGFGDPIEFTTEAIVRGDDSIVVQNPPFITGVGVGLPCALFDGDFMTGGDIAGRCVGDTASSDDPSYRLYSVSDFQLPINQRIEVAFNKEIRTSSVSLSVACLVGSDESTSDGSVALQRMQGGDCVSVVDAVITFDGQRRIEDDVALATGFTITPTRQLVAGQRYWLVICGSDGAQFNGAGDESPQSSNCVSEETIVGRDGFPINTTPIAGTGTAESGDNPNRGAGGEDLVTPFVATEASPAYFSVFTNYPAADTNGNGFLDNSAPNNALAPVAAAGTLTNDGSPGFGVNYDDIVPESFGRENYQYANALQSTTIFMSDTDSPTTNVVNLAFFGGHLPVKVEQAETGSACRDARSVLDPDDGTPIVNTQSSNSCVPVAIGSGGLTTLTGFNAGSLAPIGQTLLRYPLVDAGTENSSTPQRGYIVERCDGALNGESFSYSPCFVADLTVTVNIPDADVFQATFLALTLPQQNVQVQVYGPVAFEQNGRLSIAVRNANRFAITGSGTPGFLGNIEQRVLPGQLTLQLMGAPIHGG